LRSWKWDKAFLGNRKLAIILLGPTGSGKSPLGDYLSNHGLSDQRCVHFDFGAHLRRIAGKIKKPLFLSVSDFSTVKKVLKTGALLKQKEFSIAGKILGAFIRQKRVSHGDLLVLNGLPRHITQAWDLENLLKVTMVINLICDASVVMSRIRLNTGGDRSERKDDSLLMVRKKLKIYRSLTLPLLDHYRRKRVKVVNILVTENTSPHDIVNVIKPVNAG